MPANVLFRQVSEKKNYTKKGMRYVQVLILCLYEEVHYYPCEADASGPFWHPILVQLRIIVFVCFRRLEKSCLQQINPP